MTRIATTRMLICTFVCFLFTAPTYAQDNPLKSLWPFGKSKASTPDFTNINPFAQQQQSTGRSPFGLPSPTKLIDRAEKGTGNVFQKTRQTWKSVQDLGKSMNPFAGRPKTTQKKSMLDTFFPKQAVGSAPATMNDFMNLPRPNY